ALQGGPALRCPLARFPGSLVGPGHVARGDIAEGDGRSQRDTATRVVAAHNARRVIACGVEAGHRSAVAVQDAGLLLAAQAGEGAEIADDELHGIERAGFYRRQARIRPMFGIPERKVISGAALVKLRVLAPARRAVVGFDRAFELVRVDADLLGKLAQR